MSHINSLLHLAHTLSRLLYVSNQFLKRTSEKKSRLSMEVSSDNRLIPSVRVSLRDGRQFLLVKLLLTSFLLLVFLLQFVRQRPEEIHQISNGAPLLRTCEFLSVSPSILRVPDRIRTISFRTWLRQLISLVPVRQDEHCAAKPASQVPPSICVEST